MTALEEKNTARRERNKRNRERRHAERIPDEDGRLIAPVAKERHGSRYVYQVWGCQCDRCRGGNNARMAGYREGKKGGAEQ